MCMGGLPRRRPVTSRASASVSARIHRLGGACGSGSGSGSQMVLGLVESEEEEEEEEEFEEEHHQQQEHEHDEQHEHEQGGRRHLFSLPPREVAPAAYGAADARFYATAGP